MTLVSPAEETEGHKKARIEALQKRLVGTRYIDFAVKEISAVATLKGESKINEDPFSLTSEDLTAVELRLGMIEREKAAAGK